MRKAISDTAEWGGHLAGPRLVTDETRQEMRALLSAIRSGEFAEGWVREAREGKNRLRELRGKEEQSELEAVGRQLRSEMA